jgi:hypothetical protein
VHRFRQREDMSPRSRDENRPSFASSWTLWNWRGRREDRAPIAPVGPVQQKHGGRTTGSTGNIPAFPARWFTAYDALSSVTGLFLPPSPADDIANGRLNPSIGGPGPHAFARPHRAALVGRRLCVHRIPRPTSVTTAKRPSVGARDAGRQSYFSEKRKRNIFDKRA